ncbi:unnamed protein product [Schistocephalus solidus]|uniref:TWiK family of potassium channels protein 18 n=1 Tax=Schistocephalus solidus TaxID=70667 RepID=A0A183TJA5_SCHSO|nr:unnamed protein product [Schistocephalus solidus]
MFAATNNYDFAFEANLTSGVLDADGKVIDTSIEDNYSRNITKCCQTFIRILSSVLGTLILLCLYLGAGAWMFQYLEKSNEANACYDTYKLYLERLNTSMIRATGIVNSGLDEAEVAVRLQTAMTDFADSLFTLDFPPSKNCSVIHTTPFGSKWNWVNSLYFCATILTTIGYGHIAPKTQYGRMVCMFYCILGIPLMLIYLGSIGQMLAHAFRFVYVNLCCCRCFHDIKIRRRNRQRFRLMRLQEDLHRHLELQAKIHGEMFTLVMVDYNSDDDEEIQEIDKEFQETDEAGIPICIVMAVIAGYVAFGTYLFRIWETDWTLVDGAYFAVITISTIGFGDLVPGNGRFEQSKTITELLLGAMYCIVGLALLSMCFELMKEELVNKFRWIGSLLHLIHKGQQQPTEYQETETFAPPQHLQQPSRLPHTESAGEGKCRADSLVAPLPRKRQASLPSQKRNSRKLSRKPRAKRSPSRESVEESGSQGGGEANFAFENEVGAYVEAAEPQPQTETEEN